MPNDSELERLFVFFMGNDDHLERMYSQVVERAKLKATEVGKAFEAGFNSGFTNTGANVEASARKQERAIEDVSKAAREMTSTLVTTGNKQEKAVDEVKEAFESLRNESAGLRNAVEAGATGTEDAIKRFRELQTESLKVADGFAKNSKEYRQFTQVAAQASRSVATLEGRTTKLGFSANAAVGITGALRQNLSNIGPAGNAAGAGLGIVSEQFRLIINNGPLAGNSVKSVVTGLAGFSAALAGVGVALVGAALTGLYKLGVQAAETADLIDKASQSAGFTAEAFQEVAFALEQSGVNLDQTRQGLNDFNARLGQAAAGSKSIADAYRSLGVAIKDGNGQIRDSEAVFTDLINSLSKVPSAAEQAAKGGLVFGEEFSRKVIPALNAGAEGFQNLRDQARDMGLILSNNSVKSLVEFKDELNVLKKQFETAKIEITAGFMPVFTDLLIPLLQNSVVPWLQEVAGEVSDFTTNLRDAGPAGREFRAALAESFAPIISLIGYFQAAGASLDVLNAKVQLNGAQMGQFWRDLGQGVTDLPDTVKRFLGIDVAQPMSGGRGGSGETQLMQSAKAMLAEAETALADAIYKIENPGAITLAWLEDIAADVREGAGAFDALTNSVNDTSDAMGSVAPPPVGSLAAFRSEVAAARNAFEVAVTDEARQGALDRIAIAEAEIRAIEAIYAAADPLAPAKAWVQRLAAEFEFGLKNAAQVFDLINPRVQELREEAANALSEFGFNSTQYQDAVAKLGVLETLLTKIEGQRRSITFTVDVAPVASVVGTDLTSFAPIATVLERPLADAAFLIHKFASDASDDFQAFRSDWTSFQNDVALGAHQVATSFAISSEAVRIFGDTIEAMIASGAKTQTLFDTLSRSPAFSMTLMTGPGGDAAADLGLLQAALARQSSAWADVQSAMTEEALTAAGERYNIASAEVERLKNLYASAEVSAPDVNLGITVRADLTQQLTVAALAAEAFGTQSELAARQVAIFEGAIMRLLEADPSADISDLVLAWETLSATLGTGTASAIHSTDALVKLGDAERALAALTGDLPNKFDELRIQFLNLAAAGDITVERLEEVLATLRELENADGAANALSTLTDSLNIGTQIVDGLTGALTGIRDGDIQGALGGLTQIGVAIGTAIGGPAVGALVGAIGSGLQALVGLGQVISDLFTGDSPARRELAAGIESAVAGAFRNGIFEGLRGAEGWQDNLRESVKESIFGALVDAFIEAAVMQAILQPLIDEFTRILHASGQEEAMAYLDRELGGALDEAVSVTEDFVNRIKGHFDDSDPRGVPTVDPTAGVFELPNATVSVIAAPQWASDLSDAAVSISEAGDAMLEAARLMQSTFQAGITVNSTSSRGVDAARAA